MLKSKITLPAVVIASTCVAAAALAAVIIAVLRPDYDFTVEQWRAQEITFISAHAVKPVDTGDAGTFENGQTNGWNAQYGGKLSVSDGVAHTGAYSLKLTGITSSWFSPTYNIFPILKENGAGTYDISVWVYAENFKVDNNSGFLVRLPAETSYSFSGGNNHAFIGSYTPLKNGQWTCFTGTITVTGEDVSKNSGSILVCIDMLPEDPDIAVYFDDFTITKKHYNDPFNDVVMDVDFTGPDGKVMTMPAFWDGGGVWRVRFAPTMTGAWSYQTRVNVADPGLAGISGTIKCVPYTGDLAIYKKGFIKTEPGKRYFMYANGDPFLFIGDFHCSMAGEPFDDMFKVIVDDRAKKGFTVYISELAHGHSNGGPDVYDLTGGVRQKDIAEFRILDRCFQYIAEKGLVHSNEELFWANEFLLRDFTEEMTVKLSRYWVARYAAYPVMWATSQESDRDFYGYMSATNWGQRDYSAPANYADYNPWKVVFAAVHEYDPYNHPASAHMEHAAVTRASNSEFKDLAGYTWFAAQYTPSKDGNISFEWAKDFWEYSGERPVIMYEPSFEFLWTNHKGARIQGWQAMLHGMSGFGYGAIDIWLYNSNYDMDTISNQGSLYQVTPQMKATKWTESMNFAASTELATHLQSFFWGIEWWKLTPRFDGIGYFRNGGSWYAVSTIANDVYVGYFYNNTKYTGTFLGMKDADYTARWFNPRTGEYTDIGKVKPSDGKYAIGDKPDNEDWVLLLKCAT